MFSKLLEVNFVNPKLYLLTPILKYLSNAGQQPSVPKIILEISVLVGFLTPSTLFLSK